MIRDYWDGYFSRIYTMNGIGNGFRSCDDCGAVVYEDDLGTHRSWHRNQEESDD